MPLMSDLNDLNLRATERDQRAVSVFPDGTQENPA